MFFFIVSMLSPSARRGTHMDYCWERQKEEATRKTKTKVGWIILGWILERWDRVMWTGLVWLRIGAGGELL
jgi:hypothetical protein